MSKTEAMTTIQLLQHYKPMLRESSIKNYILSYNKLANYAKVEKVDEFVRKPKTLLKALKKMNLSKNTEKNYISAVINVIGAYHLDKRQGFTGKRYDNAIKTYRKGIFNLKTAIDTDRKERDGQMTERESKNFITYQDVKNTFRLYEKIIRDGDIDKKLYANLTSIERDMLQKYILTALYAYLPPVRNEYATLNVVYKKLSKPIEDRDAIWMPPTSKDKNYLIYKLDEDDKVEEIIIEMNQYKTSKTIGTRTISITPKGAYYVEKGYTQIARGGALWDTLLDWDKINIERRDELGKALFYDKKGRKMSRNGMTKYLYNTFKILFPNKNVSSNILRKSYHSDQQKDSNFKQELEKNTIIANSMGHSVAEAMESYVKDISATAK